jgi:hypothetical protein
MEINKPVAILAAWGALGAGIGFAAEQHTNDISRGRVITIDTCRELYPRAPEIGKDLLKCMEEGVPNGNKIGDHLKEDQPAEFVDSFRASQVDEAQTGDWGNVVLYGLGGVAAGFFFGGDIRTRPDGQRE